MKIDWSAGARRDVEEIAEFISRRSPRRAAAILAKLEAKARSLETLPDRGCVVPELSRLGIDRWRELIVAPWRIVYRRMGRAVRIYAVLDGRRNLEDLLVERVLRTAESEGEG